MTWGTDQCGSGGETSGAGVVDQDGDLNLAVLLSRDCLTIASPSTNAKTVQILAGSQPQRNEIEHERLLHEVKCMRPPPDGCLGGLCRAVSVRGYVIACEVYILQNDVCTCTTSDAVPKSIFPASFSKGIHLKRNGTLRQHGGSCSKREDTVTGF